MALVSIIFIFLWCHDVRAIDATSGHKNGRGSDKLLPVSFPSKADTLAYVDALKHSNFSQWRSLEEVAKRAGGGSCTGALNTSVLTALYLLGLFNLCAASPASCCVPSIAEKRRRRSSDSSVVKDALPPLLNSLTQNLSSLPLEQFDELPQVSNPQGGKVPVHISVVEQVRKLWDSNPRLLSNLPCTTATEAVRSSFISLSGVASGIILAYSIAQLNQCYPDHQQEHGDMNKIWFFPIPKQQEEKNNQFVVMSLPSEIPVQGEDEPDDGCARTAVQMADGNCERILSSRVCPYMQWVLLNRETGKGECFPRLCSEGKVFVEYDQLCHDVNEPGFCPEDQRLFVTAWGEAVCDCYDGMFYGPDKKCHRIYDQGYCYKGTVLQFHKPSKTLVCKTDHCKKLNNLLSQNELPFVKAQDNSCYQFGSTGPCEELEEFGFNIEKLEPSCVNLEEAGLIRSHRSYQYSHMSFPSFPDKDFPHYEVSYVILNGSTWELMMRTVGRQKRDILEDLMYENRTIIPFIDTRDFPNSIKDISSKFHRLQNDYILKEENEDTMPKETPLMLYERVKNIRLSKLKEISANNLLRKNEVNETIFKNMERSINKRENPQHTLAFSLKSDDFKIENDNNSNRSGTHDELGPGIQNITEVSYENERNNNNNNNNNNNIEKNDKIHNNTQINTGNNGSDILVKVLKGKPNPCKWEISFYSQMPNTSISFNSTSINILSHPNLAHFRIKNYDEKEKIKLEKVNSSQDSNNKYKKDADVGGLTNYTNNKNSIPDIKGESSTNGAIPDITEGILSTTKIPERLSEDSILDIKVVNITNDTSYPLSMTDLSHNVDNISNVNISEININKEIIQENISTNNTKDGEKKPAAKIDDEEQEIVLVGKEKQIIKVTQRSSTSMEETKLSQKIVKKVSSKRKKSKGKKKRRKKRKRRKNKKGRNKIKNKNLEKENGRSNDIKQNKLYSIYDDNIVEKISQNLKSLEKPESGVRNPFRGQSLPDYLRNRGRRQAGSRKGLKLGPGIINAPLLNQCRPGAKRDYNGHCRPKVIPSARVPLPRKHAKSKYYEPTPPRMKCKGGKRLDSRGVCRTTFSGLG